MKEESIEYFHMNNIPINWDELTLENREKLIDDVVGKRGYARVISLGKKDLLDMQTANAIKQIKDNLSPQYKERYLSDNLYRIVDVTWKLIERCRIGRIEKN